MHNEFKFIVSSEINEAVKSLVNCSPEKAADFRYLQGFIHGLEKSLQLLAQLEIEEVDDD